jgi:hypothetical protein
MAKRGQSVQVPIPTLGVLPHINPKEVGHAGLVSAENFIYRDGLFQTREGVQTTTEDTMPNIITADHDSFESGTLELTESGALLGGNAPGIEKYKAMSDPDAIDGSYVLVPVDASDDPVELFQSDISQAGIGFPYISGHDGGKRHTFSAYVYLEKNPGITHLQIWISASAIPQFAPPADDVRSLQNSMSYIFSEDEDFDKWHRLEVTIPADALDDGYQYKAKQSIYWISTGEASMVTKIDATKWEAADSATPWTAVGEPTLVSDFDGQMPLGFMQYDRVSGGFVDTDRIVCGTNKTIWNYKKETGGWAEIDNTPTGGSSTPIVSDTVSEAVGAQIVMRGWDQGGVTNVVCTGRSGMMRIWDGDEDGVIEEIGYASGTSNPISDVRCLAVAGSRLIAGNFKRNETIFPDAITYSNAISASSDPGYEGWPTLNIIRLADTPGEIVAMQEMGSLALAVYKTDAVYLVLVQTGTYPFRPDLKASGISGPCSPLSVTSLSDNTHAYLGRNGAVYIFDGSPPRSLGDHIQKWIRDTMEFEIMERAWLEHDKARNELHVFYPAKSSQAITRSVVINMSQPGYPMYPMRWKEDALGGAFNWTAGISASQNRDVRWEEMTEPWSAYTITWAELRTKTRAFILGNQAGTIFRVNGHDDANQPIPAYAETGLRDLGLQTQRAVVKEIDHMFNRPEESQDVTISISTSERGERRDVQQPRTIDISDPGRMVTQHRLSTHMFGMRIDADALQSVEWSGSEIAVAPRGKR